MSGLPDRTGDPGESEFGRPEIPSSIPNGSTSGSSAKYGCDKEYPFIEHLVCCLCLAPLAKAQEEGRKFWKTSCWHILCSKHEHEKGRCTSCGQTGITVHIIDKEMPAESRSFLQPSNLLVDSATGGIGNVLKTVEGLKIQNDQLFLNLKQSNKQRNSALETVTKLKEGIKQWERDRSEWERKEAEYEVQMVNLRNIVEVAKKDFGGYSHLTSMGLPRISEERDGLSDMSGNLLGKRPRTEGSSPRISLPPPGGRLSLPNGVSSSSSHGSSARGIGQVRTNLDQLRYRPPSTVPHTPGPAPMGMNGGHNIARPGSAAPFAASVPRGPVTPYSGPAPIARPMTIVDRFRQNGSTGRDDAPLRTSSAMSHHYVPEMQSPSISRVGSPAVGDQYMPQHLQQQQQGFTKYEAGGFIAPNQTRF